MAQAPAQGIIRVRRVQPADAAHWERMRQTIWPSPPHEHAREIESFLHGHRPSAVETLMAVDEADRAVGFAELSIRPYAEGCSSERVAYLEGWFVEEAERRKGVGAALVAAAEEWGRAQGCTELASDAEIDNHESAAAHRAVGFTEVARIVCFRKTL